ARTSLSIEACSPTHSSRRSCWTPTTSRSTAWSARGSTVCVTGSPFGARSCSTPPDRLRDLRPQQRGDAPPLDLDGRRCCDRGWGELNDEFGERRRGQDGDCARSADAELDRTWAEENVLEREFGGSDPNDICDRDRPPSQLTAPE